ACIGGVCPPPAVCLTQTNQCVVYASNTSIPSSKTITGSAFTACVDKAAPGRVSDCPQNRNLCTNAVYSALMRDQCPRTCGYCTGSSSRKSSSCVDLASPGQVSTCPGQKHLCQNAVYRDLMRMQCPKTCGYCT
uniref:ShKT domain-containing protein n=1 Tax=Parascaris equorum TaxID=6256 RepID=A0A914RC35_PAREQ